MEWVLWMLAVAVLGAAAVAASGRLGAMPGTVTDTPRPHLPAGPLTGADLADVRFAVVPRGYSMDQVDELLSRLSLQLSPRSESWDDGTWGEAYRAPAASADVLAEPVLSSGVLADPVPPGVSASAEVLTGATHEPVRDVAEGTPSGPVVEPERRATPELPVPPRWN